MEKYKMMNAAPVLLVMLLCSCSFEDSLLDVSRKGNVTPVSMMLNGFGDEREIFVDVDSSWTVSVTGQDAEWLSVEPQYGTGPAKVTVRSAGYETGYKTRIDILTGAGGCYPVEVKVDEPYYMGEDFDAKKAPVSFPYPEIYSFTGWSRIGPGASSAVFDGTAAYVAANAASTGYETASGQNSVCLQEAGSIFGIYDIDVSVSDDNSYTFEFHAYVLDGNGEAAAFDESAVALSVSSNGEDFLPLTYLFEGEGPWKRARSTFNIDGTDRLSFRMESDLDGCEVHIDDVRLYDAKGEAQEGDFIVRTVMPTEVDYTDAVLNGRYVYTEDGTVSETGFEYKVLGEETVAAVKSDNVGNTQFSTVLEPLERGMSYEYRAYAKTGDGTVQYGDWMELITLADPEDVDIATVRARYDGSENVLPAGWVLKGNVVSDIDNGNFSISNFALADGTSPESGIIVNLIDADRQPVDNIFEVGTPVEISLRGSRIKAGLPVRIDVYADQVKQSGEPSAVVPVPVSVDELSSYDGMLVSVEGVQSCPDQVCRPWGYGVNEPVAENTIRLESGASVLDVKVLPGASFGREIVGPDRGLISGIYMETEDGSYIMPRSIEDIALDSPREGEIVRDTVYYEDFGNGPKAKLESYTDYTAYGQNPNNVKFSSTSKDGNAMLSKNPGDGAYSGASGGFHGYINSDPRNMYMKGLNTMEGGCLYFTMGASFFVNNPSTEAKKGFLVVKCSTDQGQTWVDVPINVIEEGKGCWSLIEFDRTFVIPKSEDLWFWFNFKKNQGKWDDMTMVYYKNAE